MADGRDNLELRAQKRRSAFKELMTELDKEDEQARPVKRKVQETEITTDEIRPKPICQEEHNDDTDDENTVLYDSRSELVGASVGEELQKNDKGVEVRCIEEKSRGDQNPNKKNRHSYYSRDLSQRMSQQSDQDSGAEQENDNLYRVALVEDKQCFGRVLIQKKYRLTLNEKMASFVEDRAVSLAETILQLISKMHNRDQDARLCLGLKFANWSPYKIPMKGMDYFTVEQLTEEIRNKQQSAANIKVVEVSFTVIESLSGL